MVLDWNTFGAADNGIRVKIACGHVAQCFDAAQFLEDVDDVLSRFKIRV